MAILQHQPKKIRASTIDLSNPQNLNQWRRAKRLAVATKGCKYCGIIHPENWFVKLEVMCPSCYALNNPKKIEEARVKEEKLHHPKGGKLFAV